MNRQPPAVNVVGFLTQEVEQLRVAHGNEEIKSVVGIAHNEEQRRFLVPQGVQGQLVIGRQFSKFLDVEGGKPRTAANQDALGCLAGRQLIFFVLPDGEVVGLALLQILKHQVNRVLEVLVVLPRLHCVEKLDQRGEVLLVLRGLIVDVADERRVEQRLGLHPEIVPGLALALGVGDQRGDEL